MQSDPHFPAKKDREKRNTNVAANQVRGKSGTQEVGKDTQKRSSHKVGSWLNVSLAAAAAFAAVLGWLVGWGGGMVGN